MLSEVTAVLTYEGRASFEIKKDFNLNADQKWCLFIVFS